MIPNRNRVLFGLIGMWAGVIVALKIVRQLRDSDVITTDIMSLATAVILIYAPLGILIRQKRKMDFLDESLSDVKKSLLFFFLAMVVFLLPAFPVNHLYQKWFLDRSWHVVAYPDWWKFSLSQLTVIALPEEFFFRGFLQDGLDKLAKRRWEILGTSVSWALPVTALLFALSHSLIHFQAWHILIFFPGLVFGFLRQKTGTILAPVLFHAACNVFSQWVAVHYF